MKDEIIELVYWRENLYHDIKIIADLEYQKKAWFNASLPNVCDSFDECYMRILDDNNLNEFCEDYKLLFGENEFYNFIFDFFNDFVKYVKDSQIINLKGYFNLTDFILWDKNWFLIVDKAKLVIEHWDFENLPINNNQRHKSFEAILVGNEIFKNNIQ